MRAYRAIFPLAVMSRVLGLSLSGYYDWLHRGPSARARRDAELKGRIVAIWIGSGGIYGCSRIHAVLVAEGERVGRKRVARLMRELGIEGVTRRRFQFKTGTTKRDVWVADITYVRTWAGCTSPWCLPRGADASSVGRWRPGCRPSWSETHSRWRSPVASRRVG